MKSFDFITAPPLETRRGRSLCKGVAYASGGSVMLMSGAYEDTPGAS